MKTASRIASYRISVIHEEILRGRYPNARRLAEQLDVSVSSIGRDIEHMRSFLRAPIVFDARRNGYCYEGMVWTLPGVPFTEGELLAILVSERVLRQFEGTPYAADLRGAIEKLLVGLRDKVSIDPAPLALALSDRLSFRLSAGTAFDPLVFGTVTRAMLARRRLELEYWTASRDQVTARRVDPLHLTSLDGQWYLLAFCHLREGIRMFVPGRIRSARETGDMFEPPEGFDADAYLGTAFHVFRGEDGEAHEVVLRFTGDAARYIPERIWHPSQRLTHLEDGGVELRLTVSHLKEIERFALSWAPDCEVLEPPELRRQMQSIFETGRGRHAPLKT